MKCVIVLTEVEEMTLRQLSINHRYPDMRTRAVGLLMLAEGKFSATTIGERLGVSGQSVYNGSYAWRAQGVIGLLRCVGHKGGRPRALSPEMVAAAVRYASAESLTRDQIARRLEAEFGPLPFGHLDTLSVALKREDFTFKRNRFSLKKNATPRHLP